MIIFDLDGCLADCEHRRHFVDPDKIPDVIHGIPPSARTYGVMIMRDYYKSTGELFQPDYKSFYEACDQDKPIKSVIEILDSIYRLGLDFYIWSGRCESVRKKTLDWLSQNIPCLKVYHHYGELNPILKMRPIGDSTPDDQLKERWLDEAIADGKKIDFVFDDRPKVVRMWQKRGIFVFNCCQHDKEF